LEISNMCYIFGEKLRVMKRQRKVKVIITIEHEFIDDWFEGERKTPKEKLSEYEDAFSDIEVLENHVLSKQKYGWDVRAEYLS